MAAANFCTWVPGRALASRDMYIVYEVCLWQSESSNVLKHSNDAQRSRYVVGAMEARGREAVGATWNMLRAAGVARCVPLIQKWWPRLPYLTTRRPAGG